MCIEIVDSNDPVTLIGGGACAKSDLSRAIVHAPTLVAADGGANHALGFGYMPDAVIGDFDSVQPDIRNSVPADRLHHIAEQDSTDFDKALRNIRAPLVLGVGFLGARVDHQLAVFTVLSRYPDRRCILIGQDDVIFLAPPSLTLDCDHGTRVSLYPMTDITGRSTGLEWPIDGLTFHPAGRVGTSNRATGPVTLDFDQSGMLVILPAECLDLAITSLQAQSCLWPAL